MINILSSRIMPACWWNIVNATVERTSRKGLDRSIVSSTLFLCLVNFASFYDDKNRSLALYLCFRSLLTRLELKCWQAVTQQKEDSGLDIVFTSSSKMRPQIVVGSTNTHVMYVQCMDRREYIGITRLISTDVVLQV